MGWPMELLALIGGFVLLGQGANWLVDGGASLARGWGVRPLVVGLTVVAWGTSLPEVVVSSMSAVDGRPGAALGNVLGSNVANIGLVLGAAALVLPTILHDRMEGREAGWLLGALFALWVACYDSALTRVEAAVLLAIFATHTFVIFRSMRLPADMAAELKEEHSARYPWAGVIVGSAAIAFGARFVITGGTGLAERAGLPDTVIGLTIFAVGTSLPELAAGLGSALKGHSELSFGNVVGSNVFNCLAVIGITGLIAPFDSGDPAVATEMGMALSRDFPINLAFALVLLIIPWMAKDRLGRVKATVLAGGYLAYTAWLVIPTLLG